MSARIRISKIDSQFQIGFDGVKITSFHIEDSNGGNQNVFNTLWDHNDFNLKNGLNFQPDGNIYARITNIQHQDFKYVFDIQNDGSNVQNGTIRIFLAQKADTRDRTLTFEEIRSLMMELDRFEVNRESNLLLVDIFPTFIIILTSS